MRKTSFAESPVTALPVPGLIQLSRLLITAAIAKCAEKEQQLLAVDATCGNGHDSIFLAETLSGTAKDWSVLAYDLQRTAIDSTFRKLGAADFSHKVQLYHKSHAEMASELNALDCSASVAQISVAMFNLGYLPGSDKKLTTKAESTIAALQEILPRLCPFGIISLHAYGGHEGGAAELAEVQHFCTNLNPTYWRCALYCHCNKTIRPESLFLISHAQKAP